MQHLSIVKYSLNKIQILSVKLTFYMFLSTT